MLDFPVESRQLCVVDVDFAYSGQPALFKKVNFGIDMSSNQTAGRGSHAGKFSVYAPPTSA